MGKAHGRRIGPLGPGQLLETDVVSINKMLIEMPTKIETERLILRPYRAGDGPAYYALAANNREHLLPFEADNPALEINDQTDAEVLSRELAAEWVARRMFFMGAWHRQTGRLVAQIVLSPVNWDLPELAVGYFVDRDHEGRGFVSEGVQAALELAFDILGAARVRLSCNETNLRSVRVAERCGFTLEGHLRQTRPAHRLPDGTASGDLIFGMLRDEYEALQRPRLL